MPRLLEGDEVDLVEEQLDADMEEAFQTVDPAGNFPDLSDGGKVGEATLHPMAGGERIARGRPSARQAWMWNGTESTLPLAWNPEGTRHDGARHYLRKRFCLCCHLGGFMGRQCPNCVKNNCQHCSRSTDSQKIIPCFYTDKEKVPFPQRFYGSINCFLLDCPRRDSQGFLSEEEMRFHARSKHKGQYEAYLEVLQGSEKSEVGRLREMVEALMKAQMGNGRVATRAKQKKAGSRKSDGGRRTTDVHHPLGP